MERRRDEKERTGRSEKEAGVCGRRTRGGGGSGGDDCVYDYLKGSGCCARINKQEVIAKGLHIYFLS